MAAEPDEPDDPEAASAEDVAAEVGRTGARFGPFSVRKPKRAKESEPDAAEAPAGPEPVRWPEQTYTELVEDVVKPWSSALVRPYAHTGGRTRASQHLALEALISTSVDAATSGALTTPQRRQIVDLCLQPRSVAEVAALLSVPLGVARVLLGDLATAGAVFVHPTSTGTGDGAPDIEFMHRVLVGLRRL